MTTTTAHPSSPDAPLKGVARVRRLWKLFRKEQQDPAPFYEMLAGEAVVRLERRHGPVAGRTIIDVGCGPGFYATAFRARGARVVPFDGSHDELCLAGDPPPGAVAADAARMPFGDGSVDGVFCSNMFEHVPNPADVLAEIERVLKPGAWAYVSYTNWYSPWGGHNITPYHLLGTKRGPRVYEKRHGGPPPKNVPGEGLFPLHVKDGLRLARTQPGLRLDRAEPRYWSWAPFLTRIPGAREVLCWNLAMHLTRVPTGPNLVAGDTDA